MSKDIFVRLTIILLALTGLVNGARIVHDFSFNTILLWNIAPIVFLVLSIYIGKKLSIHDIFQNAVLLLSWPFVPLHFFITHTTLTASYGFGAFVQALFLAIFTLGYVLVFFVTALILGRKKKKRGRVKNGDRFI